MTLENLYTEQAPRVIAYFVANGMDESASADLVHEAFLHLLKKRDELSDNPELLSGLLWKTAKNLRTDHFRKTSRETLQDEVGENEGEVTMLPPFPSDLAYLRKRLTEAFAQLPPLLRETYTLFQIMNRSVKEIALITNTTESNVKVRIFRAKQKLQPLLKDLIS